jgi:hypothetical protein
VNSIRLILLKPSTSSSASIFKLHATKIHNIMSANQNPTASSTRTGAAPEVNQQEDPQQVRGMYRSPYPTPTMPMPGSRNNMAHGPLSSNPAREAPVVNEDDSDETDSDDGLDEYGGHMATDIYGNERWYPPPSGIGNLQMIQKKQATKRKSGNSSLSSLPKKSKITSSSVASSIRKMKPGHGDSDEYADDETEDVSMSGTSEKRITRSVHLHSLQPNLPTPKATPKKKKMKIVVSLDPLTFGEDKYVEAEEEDSEPNKMNNGTPNNGAPNYPTASTFGEEPQNEQDDLQQRVEAANILLQLRYGAPASRPPSLDEWDGEDDEAYERYKGREPKTSGVAPPQQGPVRQCEFIMPAKRNVAEKQCERKFYPTPSVDRYCFNHRGN